MPTIPIPVYVQLGVTFAGQAANVNYQVFDANGASVIGRNHTGVSERLDYDNVGAGAYMVIINADLSWTFPLSIEWTLAGSGGAGVFEHSVVGWEFALLRSKGATLDFSQQLIDTKATTLGGAFAALWTIGWGKILKNLTTKTLGLFGPGNVSSTPSGQFQLDDVVNPSSRTPI